MLREALVTTRLKSLAVTDDLARDGVPQSKFAGLLERKELPPRSTCPSRCTYSELKSSRGPASPAEALRVG